MGNWDISLKDIDGVCFKSFRYIKNKIKKNNEYVYVMIIVFFLIIILLDKYMFILSLLNFIFFRFIGFFFFEVWIYIFGFRYGFIDGSGN